MCKSKKMKRLLVPVQRTKSGEELLRYAGHLAAEMGAELVVLEICESRVLTFSQQYTGIKALRSFSERILSQVKGNADPAAFECTIRPGSLSACVQSVVQDYKIDLVLMETCTLHPEKEHADPNHAAAIMEIVPCPVLVVPCTCRYQKLENVVFATDFTDQDDTVLKQIVAFAQQAGAALTLVQVYNKAERRHIASYKAAMLRLQKQYHKQQINFRLLEEEDMLEGISDFAESSEADMLILATQDNYLMKRLFSSNYIKTMAYHTRYPILTFRQLKRKPCSGMCADCAGKQALKLNEVMQGR